MREVKFFAQVLDQVFHPTQLKFPTVPFTANVPNKLLFVPDVI